MKSRVILTNSNDPKYLDIKNIVDNVEIWQTLDFECIMTSKELNKKIGWKDKIYPVSFATSTMDKRIYKYSSINGDWESFARELIRTYEGGKIFVWDKNIEYDILKILIKKTKDDNRKKILRIMQYNIIDLQLLFDGAEPLITVNSELQSASLVNWSKFFDLEKNPIASKSISLNGANILLKINENNDYDENRIVQKYLKRTSNHNVLDVKTIFKIFYMIKFDSENMTFLNTVEDKNYKLK